MVLIELSKLAQQKADPGQLVPLKDKLDGFREDFKENIRRFVEQAGQGWEGFYILEEHLSPFHYYRYPYYFKLSTFETDEEPPFPSELDQFRKRLALIDELLAERDYGNYLGVVGGPFDLLLFKELFDKLQGQEKYDLLTSMYIEQDYGHSQLTREMWEEAVAEREHPWAEVPVPGDTLVIYRGESSESTPAAEAMSWTLDVNKAIFFASRAVNGENRLYRATIKREKVIDYFDHRNEAEIVCFPEDVTQLERLSQYDDRLIDRLEDARITEEYSYYRNTFMEQLYPEDDNYPGSIHGRDHTERVLYLALALAHLEGTDATERAILANIALYHDARRENDEEDPEHGRDAVLWMEEEVPVLYRITCHGLSEGYDLGTLEEADKTIVKWVIATHCIDDEEAYAELSEWNISDTEKAKRLYEIFKDADGLDRVRLGDLDVAYLRTQTALELPVFAHSLRYFLRQ